MQYTIYNSKLQLEFTLTLISRPQSLIELRPSDAPPSALADRAYAFLKQHILTCKIPPGERLIEKELCEEIGISRTPLREALNRLGLEGLVSAVPYRGYDVAPLTLDDIRNMCELRYILESESAGLAAKRATLEEIEALASLAELRYTPGDRETYENYLRANSAFHQLLAHCSHNARLEAAVISLLDQLQRPLYLGLDLGLNAEEATAEHLAVLDAVRSRDSARAAQLMREQILDAEQRMIAALATKAGSDLLRSVSNEKERG
jgi:DNA-binding GntR family transcriptional regulator